MKSLAKISLRGKKVLDILSRFRYIFKKGVEMTQCEQNEMIIYLLTGLCVLLVIYSGWLNIQWERSRQRFFDLIRRRWHDDDE